MIFYGMPEGQYRQNPALGSTDLKNILRSPAHFRHAREHHVRSKALDLGSALHAYMLEPDSFFVKYAVEPEGLVNKAKNPWKADWDKFKALCAEEGKQIVIRDDWEIIKGVQHSIRAHPWADRIFGISQTEVSAIRDSRKARADLFCEHFISDLKTCESARAFIQGVQEYQYYLQAAYYLDLFEEIDGKRRQAIWIACEKTPPYGVMVYIASDEMIELGRKEYRHALEIHKQCVEKNEWPGYNSDIVELKFKPYFKGILA